MKRPLLVFLILFCSWLAHGDSAGISVPVITISDSINPGTADYVISNIDAAEKSGAPYLIIQLDTPGGLLTTTRQIVQHMLGAKIPIVVFVEPRGGRAGSAGAIITFAADVAVMAPGTNIGAAHPVNSNGEDISKTMRDKVANDTAAFAEGLSKAHGRNTEWAIKAVRESSSIIAEEALKRQVIDLMANDLPDCMKKLSGYPLKVAKGSISTLPNTDAVQTHDVPMSIRQRLVAFFSDPSLAYLIMSLGGLCIWIELSQPGAILPGVVGTIAIILSLVAFQMMPINYGALALVFLGMGMIIGELFLPTFGLLGVGGIASFILGSLFLMDTDVPEFKISLALILPTAAAMASVAFVIGALVLESRRTKVRSGTGAMIGEKAEVREIVSNEPGQVFVHGELWNAITEDGGAIASGQTVIVAEVRDMLLVVRPT
jgi:membrane-bound serine protease (ClpP class)